VKGHQRVQSLDNPEFVREIERLRDMDRTPTQEDVASTAEVMGVRTSVGLVRRLVRRSSF